MERVRLTRSGSTMINHDSNTTESIFFTPAAATTTAADRSAATAVEGGSVTMEHQHHSNGTEANCSSSSETKPTIALMRQSRSTT
mmetsp:Transcript_26765/g.55311  ORF Transcript_26765/g.55311 Transcript_26765/m.55311 type:complete len:85 (-) Transcript_26765:84-338(-)